MQIKTVVKRDGRLKDFDFDRIMEAIHKAYIEVDGTSHTYYNQHDLLKNTIETELLKEQKEQIEIERIQDIVVKSLFKIDTQIARAYESYRNERNLERDKRGTLDKEIENIMQNCSEESTANANVDGSKIQAIKALISNVVTRDYSRRHYIPKKFRKKQRKEIYVHDEYYFGLPFWNCNNTNWQDMFQNGFQLGSTKIESPKSLESAINILSQVASHISSNTYGGVTFGNLVTGLTPYAKGSLNKYRKEAKNSTWCKNNTDEIENYAWEQLDKEAKNTAQSLEYEVQTLMTSRAETPFLTIGLDCIDLNADEETQKIQVIITKAILNQRIKGLTDGVTPVFPKIVYHLEKGNNVLSTDPYHDLYILAIKCSSLRGYPDYVMNEKTKEITGSIKPPMGCRSFLPLYYDKNGNEQNSGRFNWGVYSINLVRLAIKANHDINKFFEYLEEELNGIKELVKIKYDILKNVKAKQSPILYMSGAIARLNAEDTIESLLLSSYSTVSIGYVGIHNTLVALYGKGIDSQDNDTFNHGEEIMNYIRSWCEKTKQETSIHYSMYGTPAETLATKFCEEDVKDFGLIEGVNTNGYYENSFHYPSNTEVSPFEKLDIESRFNHYSSGGLISFVELGDMTNNLEALESIITYAYDKTPFLGISTISDRCLKCGYVGEIYNVENDDFDFKCPHCENNDKSLLSVIRKLCGYLGSLTERPTIYGKMKEIHNRINNKGCN